MASWSRSPPKGVSSLDFGPLLRGWPFFWLDPYGCDDGRALTYYKLGFPLLMRPRRSRHHTVLLQVVTRGDRQVRASSSHLARDA
jgi:hypothetical protein